MILFPKTINNNTLSVNGTENTIYIGKVVSLGTNIFDDHIIKVRLKGIDDKVSDKILVDCHPFLPRHLNIIPKIGEWVKILFWNNSNKQQNRDYIGPVISQPQKLKKDTETPFSTKLLSRVSPETSKEVLADSKGAYPEKDDIALQGRDNTDIIQREKGEVVIRSGKHKVDDNLKLNKDNPSFIHQKISDDGKTTTTNIVANKINLITHDGSPTYRGLVKDKNSDDIVDMFSGKIPDKIQKQINENGHSVIYGDKMVEFIELIKKFLVVFSLPYNGGAINETSPGWDILQEILKFDLNEGSFRSKNVKIN